MAKLYVLQDGGDFYLYDKDPSGSGLDGEDIIESWGVEHAPFEVLDGDFHAARRARMWFAEWGYFKGGKYDDLVWLSA